MVSIAAGSGITEGGSATFTITASPVPHSPITVNVGVSESGDFGASGAATVTVSGATATYTVTTANDSEDESDGSVTATLKSGSDYTVSSSQGAATVSVSDDDDPPPPPDVTVSVHDDSGLEGDIIWFRVTLSQASDAEVRVKWSTEDYPNVDGRAHRNLDYQANSGTIVIAAGETEGTGLLFLEYDDHAEEDEYFLLTLTGAEGASIADGEAVITIKDDD